MKVGVFLGYGPQARLSNEGLGRYLGGLVKGFVEADHEVSIAAPHWMIDNLRAFFREIDIPEGSIRILAQSQDPIVWKIYKKLVLNKKHRRNAIVDFIKMHFKRAAILFARTSTQSFLRYLPLYIVVLLLGLVLAIPFGVFAGVVYIVTKILNKGKKATDHLKKEALNVDEDAFFLDLFYAMTDEVVNQLIHVVNRDNECEIWYVPSLFWPQVNRINKTVIINAPDLVSTVYPAEFTDSVGMQKATADVKETLEHGKYFITYCEYIRRTLLIRDYGKPSENVIAIPHINNTFLPYIDIDTNRAAELGTDRRYDILLSQKLLNQMVSKSCPGYYADGINFEGVHYIFYASQIRPHKNMLNLIRAYEYLLRVRNVQVKLVLTGWFVPASTLPASKYVYDHYLEHDVIAFSGVSATTLAALYKCADLVVNPSMYEGGFAFTFGEGMSVGTPSLLANAPFEMEILEPAGLEEVTFDPTDWMDIAEKIEYWLPRRDELYQKEFPLYNELAKRTPDIVANDYITAFEYFLNVNCNNKLNIF